MAKTKTGITGRFGSRYGKKIRDDVKAAEEKAHATYKCPSCSRVAVKRKSAGIWVCKKCNARYASGAFEFKVK